VQVKKDLKALESLIVFYIGKVPEMEYFSKVLYTVLLALDVSNIFACILLLVGLTTARY
jgi:hypothetical protein